MRYNNARNKRANSECKSSDRVVRFLIMSSSSFSHFTIYLLYQQKKYYANAILAYVIPDNESSLIKGKNVESMILTWYIIP